VAQLSIGCDQVQKRMFLQSDTLVWSVQLCSYLA
jgi:hypothetical protein